MKTQFTLLLGLIIITGTLFSQEKDFFYSNYKFNYLNNTNKYPQEELNSNYPLLKLHAPIHAKSDYKLNILFNYGIDATESMDVAYDVLQADSFYYVYGRTQYFPHGGRKFSVVTKFDLNGNKIWQRKDSLINFAHKAIAFGHSITTLSNNNFLDVFYINFKDTIQKKTIPHPSFVCFDKDNNIKFTYIWPDTNSFVPHGGVIAEDDGGFTFTGILGSRTLRWIPDGYYLPDSFYVGIARIDTNLNIVMKKKFYINTISKDDYFLVQDIEKAHDGGYIIGGQKEAIGTISSGNPNYPWNAYKYFIIKLDSLFNLKWTKILSDSVAQDFNPITITPSKDGNYIYTREYKKNESIAYGKFDENGDILWEKYFKKVMDTTRPNFVIMDKARGVIEKDNGDIIFGSRIAFYLAIGLVRTDSVGNVKWSRMIGTNYADSLIHYTWLYNIRNPIGEGALIVGRAHTMGSTLIRTDSLGCTMPNCIDTLLAPYLAIEDIIELKKQEMIVFPNPAHDHIHFAINNQSSKITEISIYDISGIEIMNQKPESFLFTYSVSSLAKGVYIVRINGSKGKVFTRKFVIE